MRNWFLTLELIDGPVMPIVGVAVLALTVIVLAADRRTPLRLVVGAVVGAALAVVAIIVVNVTNLAEGPLPGPAVPWVVVAFALAAAGIVAVATRPWWGRFGGGLLAIAALGAGALGVNAAYGVTHTPAAILGIQALDGAPLPSKHDREHDPSEPLYAAWTPPAGMPERGRVSALTGADAIPATGFAPRDAALYLPPAALVPEPPPLPLIVFMMGQPGTPDPTFLATALDDFAAANRGLAPIAIVADQLGAPELDPVCADSAQYGAVATYFNESIPAYARQRLNIIDHPSAWVIGGYSNGGACAVKWGAEHPGIWGNIFDVSGNEFPGSEHVDDTVRDVFGGDAAAFEAAKPANIMAAAPPGTYSGHVAVFTSGELDGGFGPGQRANAAAAEAAGFTVFSTAIPGADHGGPALTDGIAFGIRSLAPALGLAPPG